MQERRVSSMFRDRRRDPMRFGWIFEEFSSIEKRGEVVHIWAAAVSFEPDVE